MFSSRPPRRLPRALLAVLLACSMPGIATAEEGIEGGAVDIFPRPLGSSNLLEPIGNLLSGRASLIARGMDLRIRWWRGGQAGRPGWRRCIDRPLAGHPGSIGGASALQEPGAGIQLQRAHHARLQQLPVPDRAAPGGQPHRLRTTWSWAPSTTTSRRTSSYVSVDAGESWRGPFHAPYLLDDLGSAAIPCSPSIARAPRT